MKFLLAILVWAFTQTGCNFLSPLDSPAGDDQLLSSARACLDRGDYICAQNAYEKLSASVGDPKYSEQAYVILDQEGAGVGPFMTAVLNSGSNGGKLVTLIGNSVGANADVPTRTAIFSAYQKYKLMTDTKSQGLVRFITATVLVADLLAEGARTVGKIQTSDIALDPTSCANSADAVAALLNANCGPPANSKISTGSQVNLSTATDISGSGPTLYLIDAAIQEIDAGISAIQSNGDKTSSASALATGLKAVSSTLASSDKAYRYTLLKLGVGTTE